MGTMLLLNVNVSEHSLVSAFYIVLTSIVPFQDQLIILINLQFISFTHSCRCILLPARESTPKISIITGKHTLIEYPILRKYSLDTILKSFMDEIGMLEQVYKYMYVCVIYSM